VLGGLELYHLQLQISCSVYCAKSCEHWLRVECCNGKRGILAHPAHTSELPRTVFRDHPSGTSRKHDVKKIL